MIQRRSQLLFSLGFLAFVALAIAWVFRSKLERALAPAESDYTPSSTLTPSYPRPSADLTPVWKVDLEPGYGGAAIDGGEVFVLDRASGRADTLRVLDLETGAELWTFSYSTEGRLEFAGSRTTPVVVNDFVYVFGSFGQVHGVDRSRREPVWSLELARDCGGEQPDFGWSGSPLVFGRLLILPALGPDVGLIALDRFSGEMVWRTPALGKSHSVPVLLELLGEPHVLFLSSEIQGRGMEEPVVVTVSAFDPETGAERWHFETLLTSVPIPPPVRVDDARIFLTGGYGGGSTLMRLRRTEYGVEAEEIFHVEKGAQLHPPVVHGEHIYLVANENSNESRRRRDQGGLTCFDLTGRELWSTGADPYFGRGHLMLLGDYLLIQDGLSGMLRMCLASPEGYTQLAAANVFETEPKARERAWAKMANSGAVFVVRGGSELRCVKLGDRRTDG